jgi:hypothetical protein
MWASRKKPFPLTLWCHISMPSVMCIRPEFKKGCIIKAVIGHWIYPLFGV